MSWVQPQSQNATWEHLAACANFRAGALARLCHVHLRTLQQRFLRDYELSLSEWLRSQRLQQAYLRISSGEQIKAVAYDLGFKQLSHFSRVFKETYGIAPTFLISKVRKHSIIHKNLPDEELFTGSIELRCK